MWNTLSYTSVILICAVLGIMATIHAYFSNNAVIKAQEKYLSLRTQLILYFNRFFHYFMSFLIRLIPFLAPVIFLNDILFLVFASIMFMIWQIYLECPITLHEKQILDPNYTAGTSQQYQPFIALLNSSDIFYTIFEYTGAFALAVVVIRVIYSSSFESWSSIRRRCLG
jgi:hypothetical protein